MTLKIGDIAPEFELKATNARTVKLSEFKGKNVVLVFFPLAWTPI